ncbi:hypothetical protein GN956_G13271 [Arapaima gigas]
MSLFWATHRTDSLLHCSVTMTMSISRQLVAVCLLALLCLCQSQSGEETDSYKMVFDRHCADGYALTEAELQDILYNEYSVYIQNPNIELFREFMKAFDTDGDGKLDLSEFKNVAAFITKTRN